MTASRYDADLAPGELHMRYRLLGRSGLRVSELFLGAVTLAEDSFWGADREDSARILDAYLREGETSWTPPSTTGAATARSCAPSTTRCRQARSCTSGSATRFH